MIIFCNNKKHSHIYVRKNIHTDTAELARSPNQFGGLENHPDLLQDAEVAQTWGNMIWWVLQLV